MKLLSLKINNLFSIGEATLDLDEIGLVLVTGFSLDEGSQNGSGKSSLTTKAITWGLFGAAPPGVRLDDVANRHTDGKAEVEIEYVGVDGKHWKISRSRRPASLKLWVEKEEWCDVSGKDVRETQDRINSSLGRDLTTFSQCEIFGHGRSSNFPDLTPSEQKNLLESILPFAELEVWENRAKEHLGNVTKLISKHEAELKGCQRELKAMQEQLDETKSSASYHTSLMANDRVALLNKIKTEQSKCASMTIEQAEENFELVQDKLNEAIALKRSWEDKVNAIAAKPRLPASGSPCPTCGSIVGEDADKMNEEINDEMIAAQSSVSLATNYYNHWSDRVNEFREMLRAAHRVSTYKGELEKLDRDNPFVGRIKKLSDRVEALRKEEETTADYVNQLREERNHLSFWVQMFSKDLKLMFVNEAAPYLQSRINHHLAHLGNPQISVEIGTVKELSTGTKDELDFRVWSTTGGLGYHALSGGEQQVVRFATGLGLSDLAATQAVGDSSLLILDEPFTRLDPRNFEAVVNYLTGDLGKQRSTILLISNDVSLMSLVPNRVHVVKERGVTRVEEAD